MPDLQTPCRRLAYREEDHAHTFREVKLQAVHSGQHTQCSTAKLSEKVHVIDCIAINPAKTCCDMLDVQYRVTDNCLHTMDLSSLMAC